MGKRVANRRGPSRNKGMQRLAQKKNERLRKEIRRGLLAKQAALYAGAAAHMKEQPAMDKPEPFFNRLASAFRLNRSRGR